MTAFEILARHFAQKTDARIIFKDKACPQTDGQTIILPKAMAETQVLPTIGALLHESAHIRYTNFTDTKNLASSNVKGLLQNLLEDIRIDTKVFNKYDGARSLYKKLIGTAFTDNPAEFNVSKCTQNFIDIVRNIYVHALNMPEFYVGKELFEKFLADEVRNKALTEILDETKRCKNTKDLRFNIDRLERMLKDYIKEVEQKQQESGEGEEKENQGEGEGESERQESSGSSSGKGEGSIKDKAKKDKKQQLKDLKKELGETEKKQEELREEKAKTKNDMQDAWNKRNQADTEEKRKQARQKTDELQKKYKNLDNKERKEQKKKEKLEDDQEDLEEELSQLGQAQSDDEVVEKLIDGELDEGHGVGKVLIGFKALTESPTFKIVKDDILNFEDNMKAIFSRLEHIQHYTNNTGRVNLKKIHKIFVGGETDYNDIFVYDKIKEESHNKIIFLLDGSGSMGNINSHKNVSLCNCVYNLAKVIDANKENYNISYEIAIFSDRVDVVQKFDNGAMPATAEGFVEEIEQHRQGGGTEICRAMEYAYARLDEVATPKDRKFVIVFTDAEFNGQDIDKILQEYNARPEKVIFIGIQQSADYYSIDQKFYEQILMKRLVSTTAEMERCLIEGFDRLI